MVLQFIKATRRVASKLGSAYMSMATRSIYTWFLIPVFSAIVEKKEPFLGKTIFSGAAPKKKGEKGATEQLVINGSDRLHHFRAMCESSYPLSGSPRTHRSSKLATGHRPPSCTRPDRRESACRGRCCEGSLYPEAPDPCSPPNFLQAIEVNPSLLPTEQANLRKSISEHRRIFIQ